MIVPSPSAQVLLHQGGALTRGPSDYPIPWRKAPWHVARFAMWDDPSEDDRARVWARSLTAALRPWRSGDVYLNFNGDEAADLLVAGLGAENVGRLVAVKDRFDPHNLFRLNHNITPSSNAGGSRKGASR
jgi:hypothetical protein